MNLRLVVVQGPDPGKSVEFTSEELVLVGRGNGCQLQILDASLSRQHCRIHCEAGRITVSDAGSAWGTFINGEKVDEATIRPGDEITIGESVLRLEVTASAEAATLIPPDREPASAATSPVAESSPEPVSEPADPEPGSTDEQTPPATEEKQKRGDVPRDQMPDIPRDIHLDKLAGWHFARYDIIQEVARSRTGIVYEALDTKTRRPIAIKFLWPEFTLDRQQSRRFVRAMKTMIDLKHENLIALRGAGLNGDLCWVASEWIAGESVTELINRVGVVGMLDWRRCWQIAHDIAKALEFAHEKDVVHRNVLPSNIMVREKDGVAKLGDLMLARALEATESEKITKAGDVIGNVSYIAPEQLSGEVSADPRIDIYSLGATVYAILTGRPPFESDSSMELLRLVLSGKIDPPTKYNLSIPPLFVDLVMRMLATNPKDRYQTMSSVIVDLKRVAKFSGESV